jgi:uncharacterized protein YdaU (DUF1376 family)
VNYYPFHIGDYAAHTGHLDPLEDVAYRRAIDAYMLTEAPLPADPADVARRIRMREWVGVVESVLREFFTLTPEGWRHGRCDDEIAKVQSKSEKARTSAAKRWHSESDANVMRTHSEGNAPKTQDPIPKSQKKDRESAPNGAAQSRGSRLPDDFPDDTAMAWCCGMRPDLDAEAVRAKFRDYWAGVPGARGRKADWPATWRNFVRSERPPARGSPAAQRDAETADFLGRLTGGLAGTKPNRDTIDVQPADVRRIV